jgi:hypothetical protein
MSGLQRFVAVRTDSAPEGALPFVKESLVSIGLTWVGWQLWHSPSCLTCKRSQVQVRCVHQIFLLNQVFDHK